MKDPEYFIEDLIEVLSTENQYSKDITFNIFVRFILNDVRNLRKDNIKLINELLLSNFTYFYYSSIWNALYKNTNSIDCLGDDFIDKVRVLRDEYLIKNADGYFIDCFDTISTYFSNTYAKNLFLFEEMVIDLIVDDYNMIIGPSNSGLFVIDKEKRRFLFTDIEVSQLSNNIDNIDKQISHNITKILKVSTEELDRIVPYDIPIDVETFRLDIEETKIYNIENKVKDVLSGDNLEFNEKLLKLNEILSETLDEMGENIQTEIVIDDDYEDIEKDDDDKNNVS